MHITLLKAGKNPDTEADMGHHEFTYALLPHTGSAAQGETIEESVRLNLPVHVLAGSAAKESHIEIGNRGVLYRRAEEGGGRRRARAARA